MHVSQTQSKNVCGINTKYTYSLCRPPSPLPLPDTGSSPLSIYIHMQHASVVLHGRLGQPDGSQVGHDVIMDTHQLAMGRQRAVPRQAPAERVLVVAHLRVEGPGTRRCLALEVLELRLVEHPTGEGHHLPVGGQSDSHTAGSPTAKALLS